MPYSFGNVYIADTNNHRIRMVSAKEVKSRATAVLPTDATVGAPLALVVDWCLREANAVYSSAIKPGCAGL
jgi:hypothetical protein